MIILRRFHLAHPEIAKVLLVETCDRELALSAFRSGARGIFAIAEANLRLLCKCLLRVAGGQNWANTEQLNYVMDLVSEVPQIAAELNLSQHTIKKYLFRIFEKLGVSTRVELVLYAVKNGDPRQAEWLTGTGGIPPRA